MKNTLFCLLVLLAFFRPGNLHATGIQQIYKAGNLQKESLSCDNDFLKGYNDLLELMEDDSNDTEDENSFSETANRSIPYFIGPDIYLNCPRQPRFYDFSLTHRLPVFILHRVFRL